MFQSGFSSSLGREEEKKRIRLTAIVAALAVVAELSDEVVSFSL